MERIIVVWGPVAKNGIGVPVVHKTTEKKPNGNKIRYDYEFMPARPNNPHDTQTAPVVEGVPAFGV